MRFEVRQRKSHVSRLTNINENFVDSKEVQEKRREDERRDENKLVNVFFKEGCLRCIVMSGLIKAFDLDQGVALLKIGCFDLPTKSMRVVDFEVSCFRVEPDVDVFDLVSLNFLELEKLNIFLIKSVGHDDDSSQHNQNVGDVDDIRRL